MVQTPEQYQFIYAALVEHILFGNTEFESDDLNNVMEENLWIFTSGESYIMLFKTQVILHLKSISKLGSKGHLRSF